MHNRNKNVQAVLESKHALKIQKKQKEINDGLQVKTRGRYRAHYIFFTYVYELFCLVIFVLIIKCYDCNVVVTRNRLLLEFPGSATRPERRRKARPLSLSKVS